MMFPPFYSSMALTQHSLDGLKPDCLNRQASCQILLSKTRMFFERRIFTPTETQ